MGKRIVDSQRTCVVLRQQEGASVASKVNRCNDGQRWAAVLSIAMDLAINEHSLSESALIANNFLFLVT